MATHHLSLLILLFSLSTAAAAHRRPLPKSDYSPAPSPQIRQACGATRFPAVCESSLSQSPSLPPSPSPLDLTLAAVSAAAADLTAAQSKAAAILAASSADINRTVAAKNCIEHLDYSSRRLSYAASAAKYSSLADARAWGSAALLYQYDCWSALKYVNGTQQVADAMAFILHLTNLTSNAVSMIAALQRYGSDVASWAPPQTERDGYWGSGGSAAVGRWGFLEDEPNANATVCKEGCGFSTVTAAMVAAPDYGAGRFVVRIREGRYEETVRVPYEKTNVVFIGDGMGRTVITGSLSVGGTVVGLSTYNTATVGVIGDGFMARDLTIENTAGPDAHQAVAFRSDSDFSILDSVEFSGHQDTLYAHSLRQYYRSCLISGTVDFIFGNSAAVFENCTVLLVPRQLSPEKGESNTVSAHGRTDPAQSTGFVFRDCLVNASDAYVALYRQKPSVHRVYLGRPWKEYSRTVFVGCYMAEIVRPEGWMPWDGDFALGTLFYGEFGSRGPGANATARVPWSSQIPGEHVEVYSVENFIQGYQWMIHDTQ